MRSTIRQSGYSKERPNISEMAKKKKTPVNPARGFATTSVASKNKLQAEEDATAPKTVANVNQPDPEAITLQQMSLKESSLQPEKEITQLTADELEEQLERDELQLLVEKYAAKARRDSTRQISKCETDMRLLRIQAQSLPKDVLPEEAVFQIISEAQKYSSPGGSSRVGLQSKSIAEEELLIKLWTLQMVLSGMGFTFGRIREVLKVIGSAKHVAESNSSVWGLNESLDFLAKELEEEELPSFNMRHGIQLQSQASSVRNSPSTSRPLTPTKEQERLQDGTTASQPALRQPMFPDAHDDDDFEVSDLGSDLEPDELVTEFVQTQSKLYRLRSDLVEGPKKVSKKITNKHGSQLTNGRQPAGVRKLQEKLTQIRNDPLFDTDAADREWFLKRITIEREAALERHRDHSPVSSDRSRVEASDTNASSYDDPGSGPSATPHGDSQPGAKRASSPSQGTNDEDLLGGMFEAPPEGSTIVSSGNMSSNGTETYIRNFGKLTDLHPRKVLEDACRSRDSNVRLAYQIVSPTQYACRHSVTIGWTIPQPKVDIAVPPSLSLSQQDSSKKAGCVSSFTCTMATVATPDSQQSEAYVATAALFCVFGRSVAEAKSFLKLPPAWRELFREFESYDRASVDSADRTTLKELRSFIEETAQQEEDGGVALLSGVGEFGQAAPLKATRNNLDRPPNSLSPDELKNLWRIKSSSNKFQEMLRYRLQLPMATFRDTAIAAMEGHQVLILCGETGCGKSTQLPAYILEHELSQGRDCKIYCTEPRRISAITLAQRVSAELGEHQSDLGTSKSLVGYAIRLETKLSVQTRLIYATVGIVLRMLESSKHLTDVTHLIIDEVHERSIDTDFLLIVLKTLLIRRPDLKVILMSATVDASRFSKYLNDATIVNVPGRTFPVRTFFLEDTVELTNWTTNSNTTSRSTVEEDDESEQTTKGVGQLEGYSAETKRFLIEYDEYQIDYELIVRLLEFLATNPTYRPFNRAILVFLPGIAEIRELHGTLTSHSSFLQTLVYPLHSSITSDEQQKAFVIPPPGIQKIVLATNIAETGITIPDITCVIDCGRHREMRFDEKRQISRLIQSFISRANAKQRRGRAGRVQEGLCFHLFTKYRHDEIMSDEQAPEMLRLSLQDLVMRVKICKLGDIEQTLAQALDPPAPKNIRRAIDALIEVRALTPQQELTVLGSQLAKLPLDAMLGKLCLLAAVFRCLDVGLTIAAILSSKSPFLTPFGAREQADQARLAFAKGDSDLLTAYNAYYAWKKVSQARDQSVFAFCRKHFLSPQNLTAIEDLKGQLLAAMIDTGLISRNTPQRRGPHRGRTFVEVPAELNDNSENETVISSVIAWSFYPKLLVRDGKGWRNASNSKTITLHPTSVNQGNTNARYLSYYSIIQTSSKGLNALSTTAIEELPLLLFGGDAKFTLHAGVVAIDGNRLRFSVTNWKTIVALKAMRDSMEEFVEAALATSNGALSPRLKKWIEIWEELCNTVNERKKSS